MSGMNEGPFWAGVLFALAVLCVPLALAFVIERAFVWWRRRP